MEDWDPRFIVTTLSCSQEGDMISLSQIAEKDMAATQDSLVILEVEEEDPDTMIMTASAKDVIGKKNDKCQIFYVFFVSPKFFNIGWRKFERQKSTTRFPERHDSSSSRTVK